MIVGGGGEQELLDLKGNSNFSVIITHSHFKTSCYLSESFIVLFNFRFPTSFLLFLLVLAIGRTVELSPASARHWWSSPALFHAADKDNMYITNHYFMEPFLFNRSNKSRCFTFISLFLSDGTSFKILPWIFSTSNWALWCSQTCTGPLSWMEVFCFKYAVYIKTSTTRREQYWFA